MEYNLTYDITGLAFLIILMVNFFRKKHVPNSINKIFGLLLFFSFVSIVFDIYSAYTISYRDLVPVRVNMVICEIYFLSQLTLAYLSFLYVFALTDNLYNVFDKKSLRFFTGIYILSCIFLLQNFITGNVFYFDENRLYTYGPFFFVYFFFGLFFIISDLIYPIIKRNSLVREQIIQIDLYALIIIVSIIIQHYYPKELICGVAVVLADYMVYATIQKPEENYDSLTGVYTRNVLIKEVENFMTNGKDFQLIIIDMKGTSNFNTALGENFTDMILIKLALLLGEIAPDKLVFRVESDTFCILTNKESEMHKILFKIKTQFPQNVIIEHKNIEINISFNFIKNGSDIKNAQELNSLIVLGLKDHDGSAYGVDKKSLLSLRNYRDIENLVYEAIEKRSFEIYFQPIFNTETQTFVAAEALVRLLDGSGTVLTPNQFLPIAEENSLINQIDMIMCYKTCRVLSLLKKTHPHFTISCNLSLYDFLSGTLYEQVHGILSETGADSKNLILEITENISSVTPHLNDIMLALKEKNIRLAMDDFGTGFSNFDSILRLPFDIYKIDRSLLLLCEQSPQYQVVITNVVTALKDLGRIVLIEGIETKEQSLMAVSMGVTIHQGFLYSRPVREKELYQKINDPPLFSFLNKKI